MRNVISKLGVLLQLASDFALFREQIKLFRENPSVEGGLVLTENLNNFIERYENAFK